MEIHQLLQSSQEWRQHRANHLNASDIPVVMGLSSYKTRDQLLEERKTGVTPEIDAETQKRFDDGHRFEAMAREIIEAELGEGLYPVVGSETVDGLALSASFDGIDLLETFCFEHKSLNNKLSQVKTIDDLDKQYKAQMQQQLMVSGAEKCLFVASNGTEEGMIKVWFEYNESLAKEIIAAWKQFLIDLELFTPTEVVVMPIADAITDLPAISITAHGGITESNLDVYVAKADRFLTGINKTLITDNDFVQAKETVKFLVSSGKRIESTIDQVLGQVVDIDEAVKVLKSVKENIDRVRIDLDKDVKKKEKSRKEEIVNIGKQDLQDHIEKLNKSIAPYSVGRHDADFVSAAKNKRNLKSLENAVNTVVANEKILISEHEQLIRQNMNALADKASDYMFLFNDAQDVIHSDPSHFCLLVDKRISDHKAEEERKLEAERERVRKEEQAKAQREAEATAEKERERIRKEEQEKAREDQAKRDAEEADLQEKQRVAQLDQREVEKAADTIPDQVDADVAAEKEPKSPMAAESNTLNDLILNDLTPFDAWYEDHGVEFRVADKESARVGWDAAVWHLQNIEDAA